MMIEEVYRDGVLIETIEHPDIPGEEVPTSEEPMISFLQAVASGIDPQNAAQQALEGSS